MVEEPVPGVVGDLVQRSRLLEQVRGAGDDHQAGLAAESPLGLAVEVDDGVVVPPDDEQGGLVAMERRNNEKAEILYSALDRMSGFYRAPVEKAARSTMNIVFRLPNEELDDKFVAEAKKQIDARRTEVQADTVRKVALVTRDTENVKQFNEAEIEKLKAEYGAKIAKLEDDFRAAVTVRDQLRKKLAAADQQLEQLQGVVKERDELRHPALV